MSVHWSRAGALNGLTRIALAALVVSVFGCGSSSPSGAGLASTRSGVTAGFVSIVSQNSGKCLGASGGLAVQQTCTGALAQAWSLATVSGGYQIVSELDPTQCLNVPGDTTTEGVELAVTTCSTGAGTGDVWTTRTAGAYLNLVAADTQQCVDVAGWLTTDGAVIDQWPCNGQPNQGWTLQPVAPPADAAAEAAADAADAEAAPVSIVSQNSGKCLGASGGLAVQQTCTGAPGQGWSFAAVAGGYQIISALDPTQCLNVPGDSTTEGLQLAVGTCSSGAGTGDVWTTQTVGAYVNIVAADTQQCVDVAGWSTTDGAVIDQWPCNGQPNQGWTLQSPTSSADASVDGTVEAAGADATVIPADADADVGAASSVPVVSIVSQNSGKCLASSGGLAVQQTCTGAPAQEWSFTAVPGGYQITSALDPTQCLNVPGDSTTEGLDLAIATCSTGAGSGDVWTTQTAGAYVNIVAGDTKQCLDVGGWSIADGAAIDQWPCSGQPNQAWTLVTATGSADAAADGTQQVSAAPSGPPLAPSLVSLVSGNGGACLGIAGGLAVQQACTGAPAQQWSFSPASGGYTIASALDPAQCLTVPGDSIAVGIQLAVIPCGSGGGPGQVWSTTAAGASSAIGAAANIAIAAADTQQCIDVSGGSLAEGAVIDQAPCSGQPDQSWTIAPSVVTLVAQNSSLCLGIDGTAAVQQTCAGNTSQKWQFKSVSGGFQIVSLLQPTMCLNTASAPTTAGQPVSVTTCSSGGVPGEIWSASSTSSTTPLVATQSRFCLDVVGAQIIDGAGIDQYPCTGQPNQLWAIQPASNDPADLGAWTPIIPLPSIPVAAAMLPSGSLLTWASWEPDGYGSPDAPQTYVNVFDPQTLTATGSIVTQTSHDMFCPGTAMLADGRLLINGGGPDVANTSLYDSLAATWSADALMNQPRWYPVSVTLPDGRVFTLGGNRLSGLDGTGEIWTPGGAWQTVPGAVMDPILTADPTNRSQEHPRLFVAPNGLIFVPGPTPNMQFYDLADGGSIQSAGTRGDDTFSQNDVTVMFDVGKLLKAGGNTNYDGPGADVTPSSASAYVIDISGGGLPAVQKIAPLNHARAYASGVLLPDGQVLVFGGLDNGLAFSDVGAVLTPEVFDPVAQTWTDLLPMDVPRTYHSVALLMPDGRVFVGGGGLCGTGCNANHSDAQVYSPPYLFQGSRPQITSAPNAASYGSTIAVSTSGTVTGFSWIRMSAITHTVNTDQRWMAAPSTSTGAGGYSVSVPANANLAPPGYYMLFALNGTVPSVAAFVKVGP